MLGKSAGVAVLLIDALKGFLPAKFLLFGAVPATHEYHSMLAGLCAILGHNYTCWLRFKGGKGIATSAGVILALVPAGLAIALGVWILAFATSRYVSFASIMAAAILPLGVWIAGQSGRMIALAAGLGALAIYKHRTNIQRLLAGTEHRFGSKNAKP